MAVKLEREAKEKLHFDVETSEDPSGYTVEVAFTDKTADPDGRPGGSGPAAWTAATWAGPATGGGTSWTRVAVTPLIGDGTLDLAISTWQLWSRVTGGSEQAVDRVDTVKIA